MAYDASNPYGITQNANIYEQKAGVTPPAYQSMVGADGNVKAGYQVDPSQSAAFKKMQDTAMSGDLSPWAQMQMQQNTLATSQQRDQANAQAQGSTDQAMQQLMTTGGGSSSGAAAFLANQGARNTMAANQNIGAQAQTNALGIQSTDAQNKQAMLGQVSGIETGAQSANAQTAMNDTNAANLFNANRYQQQMAAWGAQQTASGQESAASAAGSGRKK